LNISRCSIIYYIYIRLKALLQFVTIYFPYIFLTTFSISKILYYTSNIIYLKLSPFPLLKEDFSDSDTFTVTSQLWPLYQRFIPPHSSYFVPPPSFGFSYQVSSDIASNGIHQFPPCCHDVCSNRKLMTDRRSMLVVRFPSHLLFFLLFLFLNIQLTSRRPVSTSGGWRSRLLQKNTLAPSGTPSVIKKIVAEINNTLPKISSSFSSCCHQSIKQSGLFSHTSSSVR
jgi:hypothetical protein